MLKRLIAFFLALALCSVPAFALTRGLMVDSSATIGASSTQVLPVDTFRGYLMVSNPNASNTFWCNFAGGTAAANTSGNVFFGTNASIIFDASVPTSAVNCIGSGASTIITIYVITNVSM